EQHRRTRVLGPGRLSLKDIPNHRKSTDRSSRRSLQLDEQYAPGASSDLGHNNELHEPQQRQFRPDHKCLRSAAVAVRVEIRFLNSPPWLGGVDAPSRNIAEGILMKGADGAVRSISAQICSEVELTAPSAPR